MEACERQIGGRLMDDSFNTGYQESVTLTISEMRGLCNKLRHIEGKRLVLPFDRLDEDSCRHEYEPGTKKCKFCYEG